MGSNCGGMERCRGCDPPQERNPARQDSVSQIFTVHRRTNEIRIRKKNCRFCAGSCGSGRNVSFNTGDCQGGSTACEGNRCIQISGRGKLVRSQKCRLQLCVHQGGKRKERFRSVLCGEYGGSDCGWHEGRRLHLFLCDNRRGRDDGGSVCHCGDGAIFDQLSGRI